MRFGFLGTFFCTLLISLFFISSYSNAECDYKINPQNASFDCDGGSFVFHANATGQTCVELSCKLVADQLPDEWITGFSNCSSITNHFKNGTVQYIVSDEINVSNSTQSAQRNTTVIIGDQKLLIKQSGDCNASDDDEVGCVLNPKSKTDWSLVFLLSMVTLYALIQRIRKKI